MLTEMLLEILCFLDRSTLEACQLVNLRYLGVITNSNGALALRRMDALLVVRLIKTFNTFLPVDYCYCSKLK